MRLVNKSEVQINHETYEPTIDVTFQVSLTTIQDLKFMAAMVGPDEAAIVVGRAFLDALQK